LGLARLVTREWGAPIGVLRAELELRPTPQSLLSDRFSPLLNLALFSDVLGSPQPDWPPNTVQTGFLFYDRPLEGPAVGPDLRLEEFFRAGAPPVVFTLGSAAVMDAGRFFEASAAAARQLRIRAVLIMGQNTPPTGDSTDLFTCDYAPYSQVFARAACVVHQGGVGTTAQAFKASVPQLVMPFAFDQPDNAARVVRIGAGLSVSKKDYQVERIDRTLKRLVLTPHFRQRARGIGQQITAQNGVLMACEAIEKVLGR
jgi:UDP:flavonoid glycosyltransferase YjiC (YdhE family)